MDVVHLHGMHYPHNFIGYFWARILRKKVVMTPHFFPGHHFYERRSHYWLLKQCDAVFAVSDLEREHLIKGGVNRNKVFTVGNAIDLEEYQAEGLDSFRENLCAKYVIQPQEKMVIFLGRRVQYKGIDPLMQAVFDINRSYNPKIRLLIAGPSMKWFDDYYDQLPANQKKQIVDLGIVSHQEKVNLLHLSDIVALPSEYEAFGIVFLEAWACGKPVIGGDRGAMPQIIEGGGMTVPYGDVEKLRQAIQFFITQPSVGVEMAKRGKQKLKNHYTTEIVGNKVLRVLKEMAHC